MHLAKRDLRAAEEIIDEPDWAYSIAYNASLQAGRAYMFAKGYRPIGSAKHVSVIEFLRKCGIDITHLNRMRRKRHLAVYEYVDIISREEAKDALKEAASIVWVIEHRMSD